MSTKAAPLDWEAMAGSIIDTVHLTSEDYVNEKLVGQLKRYFTQKTAETGLSEALRECSDCGSTEAKMTTPGWRCSNDWHYAAQPLKAEGATTQPTPVAVPQRYLIPDEECLPKYFVDVEPVPSAGSKPQEGGGGGDGDQEIRECEACATKWFFPRSSECPVCAYIRSADARIAANPSLSPKGSQPVADGGGLPLLPEHLRFHCPAALEERERQFSSCREALREMTRDRNLWQEAHDEDCPNRVMADALKERMQQAVEKLKTVSAWSEQDAIAELILLLSPEGSSR